MDMDPKDFGKDTKRILRIAKGSGSSPCDVEMMLLTVTSMSTMGKNLFDANKTLKSTHSDHNCFAFVCGGLLKNETYPKIIC
jgi:signal recognition particle GTPase